MAIVFVLLSDTALCASGLGVKAVQAVFVAIILAYVRFTSYNCPEVTGQG